MKRLFKGIAALSLAVSVFAGTAVTTQAMGNSYTYNYDYWKDVQSSPDFYTPRKVYTSDELGLDKKLKNPQSLFVRGNELYIVDTGNNRIIQMEKGANETLSVVRYIDSFKGDVENTTFSGPTDIAVSEEGCFFIADKGNQRILKLDNDLNYLMQFNVHVDSTLDPDITFQPNKLAVDTAS